MKFKKIALSLTLISALLVGCGTSGKNEPASTNAENTAESTDSTEANKNEQKENMKISVASVAISEVLAAMEQEVVGRPTTKLKLPEMYQNVAEIGSSHSPDFEKILAVGTELLIGDEMFKSKIEKTASEYNIDTFYVNTSTYQKFIESIEGLGKKINKEEEAKKVIQTINAPLEKYKDKSSDKTIAIIFGTSESNQLATDESYIGSLLKALGGKNIVNAIAEKNSNVLDKVENGYINLNIEQILQTPPDIIVRFGHGNVEEANKSFEKLFNENPAWKDLDAVKNNKVYDLDASVFGVSANLKIDKALEQLGEIIYEK